MVTEYQEKSIYGLLFLGKQAYQPASKASNFRSWIFINPASSSQFIQYFIFILVHICSLKVLNIKRTMILYSIFHTLDISKSFERT